MGNADEFAPMIEFRLHEFSAAVVEWREAFLLSLRQPYSDIVNSFCDPRSGSLFTPFPSCPVDEKLRKITSVTALVG